MFSDFYLRDSLNITLAHQRIAELRREMAEIHMGRQFADQAVARRRFFRMYRIRNIMFRVAPGLAARLVL